MRPINNNKFLIKSKLNYRAKTAGYLNLLSIGNNRCNKPKKSNFLELSSKLCSKFPYQKLSI